MRSDIELAKISWDSLNYARTIEELKHIEDIVNSLLSLSEIWWSGEKRDIRVWEFTGKIVSKIKKNFKKKNIWVELAIIKDFNIKVNDKLFDIMLKNIIENAFKYSLENTNINISVSQNIIKIANTGKIISQDEIDNLFQPFYKGSNSESGYWLGLNIVKTIADQNWWKIRFWAEKEIYTLEVEF
jgi:signal transduction histidine kinase